MKYAEILEVNRNGFVCYRLICPDPNLCRSFDEWSYQTAKILKVNTRKAYAVAVVEWINFLNAIDVQNGGLTHALLSEALDAYESFLVFGEGSSSLIASNAAKLLGSKCLSGASIAMKFSGVNSFLKASEAVKVGVSDLQNSGYLVEDPVSELSILDSFSEVASPKVRWAIKAKSWFAGCIAGGVKRVRRSRLSAVSKPASIAFTNVDGGDDRAFPIDKCADLIADASCLRDAVLWSFLAASGCRISEALTIQLEDIVINLDEGGASKVLIVDPASRRHVFSKYLSEISLSKISHKGRSSSETYLIEPFASMFWVRLGQYIEEQKLLERSRGRYVLHRFLFRNLRDGSPIPTSYQAVWERFNVAALKVTGKSYGFHSLRHMYAYYLLNHCPNPASFSSGGSPRFGLDMKSVQQFMGHKSIKSTEVYARRDAKMLDATFSAANMLRLAHANHSVVAVQISHLESEIEQLKKELAAGVGSD